MDLGALRHLRRLTLTDVLPEVSYLEPYITFMWQTGNYGIGGGGWAAGDGRLRIYDKYIMLRSSIIPVSA